MEQNKCLWVAVNYRTGEVLQVGEPCTAMQALRIFKEHQGGTLKGFNLYESINSVEPIVKPV